LRPRSVSTAHRPMLPWASGSNTFRCCRAVFTVRHPAFAGRFASRFQPASAPLDPRSPGPEGPWGGKESRLCLAPNNRCWCSPRHEDEENRPPVPARWQPEDCCASGPARPIPRRERSRSVAFGSGATRRRHLGRAPSNPRRDWRSARFQPEGSPLRRSVSPEGARSPAHRVAGSSSEEKEQCRDPASAPEGWHRWFELPPIILLRSPAYLMIGSLAACCTHPKVWSQARHPRSRHSLHTANGRSRRTPPRDPRRNRIGRANRVAARRLLARQVHSRLVAPVRTQQAGAAGLGPNSHRLHRKRSGPKSPHCARRRAGQHRSAGSAVVPRIHPGGWDPP
jgi:hypothetical protein